MDNEFMWGVSDAAFQSDGILADNEWTKWLKDTGKDAEYIEHSPHFFSHPDDVIKTIKELSLNTYRFSLDWSYIEPKEGEYNEEAIRYYKNFLQKLHEQGIEPVVTLNHFVHPLWFIQKGGWVYHDNIKYFLTFCQMAAETFKEDVTYWITINEPTTYLRYSYIQGLRPPFKKNWIDVIKILKNMLDANNEAYKQIHTIYKNKKVMVGMANAIWPIINFNKEKKRKRFYKGVLKILNFLVNYLLIFLTKKYTDFIGVNFYSIIPINSSIAYNFLVKFKDNIFDEYKKLNLPLSLFGWPIYNYGLFLTLNELSIYRKPIFITENGIWDKDNVREMYIKENIDIILRAKEKGINVIGYLYWTLADNYEWELGYKPKFGLSTYDKENDSYRIKPSGIYYKQLVEKYTKDM